MFDDLIPKSPHADRISSVESGGRYDARGPVIPKTGDRAYGKYQVMGANVPEWTQTHTGQSMTPDQFLANPDAQEAVFNGQFGQYVNKYGPEGASRAWFAGESGMNNPNAKDVLGTTVAQYSQKFMGAQPAQQPAALSFDDLVPKQSPNQTVEQRFGSFTQDGAEGLQSGLRTAANQMQDATRGPAVSPAQQASTDFQNQGIAAGQRTTPNIRAQMQNLVSDQVFESDAGTAVFRDPATGKLVEAQDNQHVVLRDPADNRLKVFARTENTDEGALSAGGRLMGTGLAAAAATRRPAIPTPAAQAEVKASDIFATAKPRYRAFDAASDAAGPQDSSGYAQRIKDAMKAGKVPQHLADEVYKSVDEIGETASLADLRSVKELIGQSSRSNDSRVRQAAGIAAKEITRIIGEVSAEAGKNLKTADEIFSTAKSVQDLQRKESIAGLRAGRAGYGGNAVNTMRQALSPIVQRSIEGKTTGFKPDEIAAMREIVEGSGATNAFRMAGQYSPSRGAVNSTVGAMAGSSVAGPIGYAVPALGAASNKIATILTGQQIDRLKELVAKRSPAYAEAVQKSVERYEKAQMELVNKPGATSVAAFIAASRQLSSGLTRDGIPVSSADLIRSIQGPMRGAAEDEQPKPEGVVNQ